MGIGEGLDLDEDFESPSYADWRALVDDLDALSSTDYNGIRIQPLYTAESAAPRANGLGVPPFVRSSRPPSLRPASWDIRQCVTDPDPARARAELRADLQSGATSVWLPLGDGRVPISALPELLAEVELDLTGVALDAGHETEAAARALFDSTEEQAVAGDALWGSLGADPLGTWARTGDRQDHSAAIRLAQRCWRAHPRLRAITVDAQPYHEAGGSEAQELGCSMAVATAYLRELTDSGLDIDSACRLIEFRYTATADQFHTIAKLRAARRMWERVTRASGASASVRAQQQHAVTSSAMLTARDPWVNIMRGTLACFGAAVGGALAITVRPFDNAIGVPEEFGRRVARNTHLVLAHEADLAQVLDPAGGSYHVETLTDELAHQAWDWFQRIESEGGCAQAFTSGLIPETLEQTWQQRQRRLSSNREPITGVSAYPHLDEVSLVRQPVAGSRPGGLPLRRYSEEFERLRLASDSQSTRPRVFLATLGTRGQHSESASFARNLFAAGGIATTSSGSTNSTTELVECFRQANTPVACICVSEELGAQEATDVAAALRNAGAMLIGSTEIPDRSNEIDVYLTENCDFLSILRDVHRALGVVV